MNKKTLTFTRNRLIKLTTLLLAVAIVSFMLVEFSPLDPVKTYLGSKSVSAEQKEKIGEYWGVNQPPAEKFAKWGSNMLKGDLGISLIYRMPVTEVIKMKVMNSIILMFLSWVLSGVLGFLLGIVAAMKQGTWIDKIIKTYCYILQATPTFWIGLILIIIFGVYLKLIPIGLSVPVGTVSTDVTFIEWLSRLIFPVITLSILGISQITMFTREKLIEEMNNDYILFAKAQGESEKSIIKRHGIRNILFPFITLQFLSFSELFGGAIIIEKIFSYPGLGQAVVDAGLKSDIPLLLSIVLFSAIFVFVGNLIADILYKFIDPRVKDNEEIV